MTEIDKRARMAGAMYLGASLPAFFSMMYVQSRVVVHRDLLGTVDRILGSEAIFRWGLAADLVANAAWIFVPLALYRLLAEVDRGLASLMVILGIMGVPIVAAADMGEIAALSILHDAGLAASETVAQVKALAGLGLRLHFGGLVAAELFWGLWLFPFAALVWRSGFLPRFLGVLLAIGGIGWTVDCLLTVIDPAAADRLSSATQVATALGELPVIFWLIVVGARQRGAALTAAAPAAAE